MTERIYENGIYRAPGARLSDLAAEKRLPIGNDNFRALMHESVFVDKSLLVADVLGRGTAVSLYCRPRRFGKSLNLSMLQAFLEIENPSDPAWENPEPLFRGLGIWEVDGGRWRAYMAAYPVVRLSLNNAKDASWAMVVQTLRQTMAAEYARHGYLAESPALSPDERARFRRIAGADPTNGELKGSLLLLTQLLQRHHGTAVVVLIDEYDAPVMAAATNGYYHEATSFLKGWLTGALKSNDALALGVLTGVQRISKESIFSDLNNLTVDTPMSLASDERYGFTQAEVEALAAYREQTGGVELAREWYDGYRFGAVDVYNPWSTLSFFQNACAPDLYWMNTSGNGVLNQLAATSDAATLGKLYRLLEPDGFIEEGVDTATVFADAGLPAGNAVWSLLYLAGYLTTDDTALPGKARLPRRLRIPNLEVREVFRDEVIARFEQEAGGRDRLRELHEALREGDAETVAEELERILLDSASNHDLTRENSYHMLALGLMFGMHGYSDPVSNREAGRGLFDVRILPENPDQNPVLVLELKWAKPGAPAAAGLPALAEEAVAQARDRAYASGSNAGAAGTMLWGLAFSGKELSATCERA